MKKEIWILIILAIIIVALLAVFVFVPARPAKTNQQKNMEGIQITSPKINEELSLPIKVTGTVNGSGWSGFEGQVGHVDLISNGATVGSVPLKATTDWTVSPTSFEASVFSQLECFVAPCYYTGDAELIFHNENPSGDPTKDKTFTLPVKIK